MSFGFAADRDEWEQTSDGQIIRNLLECTLWEISVVGSPAYEATSVSLRSCPADIRSRLNDYDDFDDLDDNDDANDDDDDDNEDEERDCDCSCPECEAGDCDDCSNDDCDDEECSGCLMQDELRADKLRVRSLFTFRMK
jgi:hypothetical protein